VLFWTQRSAATCTSNAQCNRPVVRGATLVGLLLGFALLYLGYAYA
jgi:mercuric ion transport protein